MKCEKGKLRALKRKQQRRVLDMRTKAIQQRTIRMAFCGWSQEKIARKMRLSARCVNNHLTSPAFLDAYREYEAQQMAIVDRSMPRLLVAAVEALHRMLTHRDWRAREAALDKILLPYGRVLEYLLDQRNQDPRGTVRMLPAFDDMTDEMRTKARELLNMVRHLRPALIERIQQERPENGQN